MGSMGSISFMGDTTARTKMVTERDEKGGRWNARGVTRAEPQKDGGRRTRVRTRRLGTGAQPHRLEGGEQADGMAVGGGRQGGSPQGTVGRRGRQVNPPEHPTRRDESQVKTRQGNMARKTNDQGGKDRAGGEVEARFLRRRYG